MKNPENPVPPQDGKKVEQQGNPKNLEEKQQKQTNKQEEQQETPQMTEEEYKKYQEKKEQQENYEYEEGLWKALGEQREEHKQIDEEINNKRKELDKEYGDIRNKLVEKIKEIQEIIDRMLIKKKSLFEKEKVVFFDNLKDKEKLYKNIADIRSINGEFGRLDTRIMFFRTGDIGKVTYNRGVPESMKNKSHGIRYIYEGIQAKKQLRKEKEEEELKILTVIEEVNKRIINGLFESTEKLDNLLLNKQIKKKMFGKDEYYLDGIKDKKEFKDIMSELKIASDRMTFQLTNRWTELDKIANKWDKNESYRQF